MSSLAYWFDIHVLILIIKLAEERILIQFYWLRRDSSNKVKNGYNIMTNKVEPFYVTQKM